jgi:hypothetical protein
MQYKTMVLELLQQNPEFYQQLLSTRTLLSTLESHARQLRARHEAWKHSLSQAKPDSDASQIASEALEMALKELEDHLPSGLPPHESEALSLDAAMAFVRGRPRPG